VDFRTITKVNVDDSSLFAHAGRGRENGHLELPHRVSSLLSASVPSPVPSLGEDNS